MDDLRSFYEREPAFLRHHAREFMQSPAVDLTEQ